jgi:peptidoglycan/xylan/chitin deacetylase (PgdA/CDA1 family)
MRHRLGRLAARAARRFVGHAGIALVYHRVGSPGGDERYELSPALDSGLFEEHLRHLRANYRVVPPSQLFDIASDRRPGERVPVAITFDDDLSSHVDVVVPALVRAGLPAAFFLCGTSVDTPQAFWWQDLQTLVDERRLPFRLSAWPDLDLGPAARGLPGAIHDVAERIERLGPKARDAVASELRALTDGERGGLSASDVREIAAAGFEIGFHTRRHYLLPTLDDSALRSAMREGRDRLEVLAGGRLKMIAYPHGKADERVAAAARAEGYERGFTAWAFPVGPTTDPLLTGRLETPPVPTPELGRLIAHILARRPAEHGFP